MALTEAQKKQAKKTRKYWADREAEALNQRVKDEKQYDKRLRQIYSDMSDNVQREINAFYGKYADGEGISIAEAKKRVKSLDIATYERKAKRYVRDKEFSAEANEEMRLYNATMRINRLEMLKANIGLELINGHQELENFMAGILQDRTEDELKRQAGILGKTIKNNAQKANAIVNASFHNATFSDRIWQYQSIMKADLAKLLQSGLIQGKNPRVLAKELKKRFDVSTHNAERLMRTELARVQTEAQKQSFERNGFKEYEFIVNGGCCDICAALNGKHFKVDKMLPGENAPPMHPHCRCSTAAYENSKEYEAWLEHLEKGGTTEEYDKQIKSQQQKGLAAKISGKGIPEHEAPVLLKTIDYNDKEAVKKELQNFEKGAINENVETALVITQDGKVYKCFGVSDRVFPDSDLGEEFKGATVTHNHPAKHTAYSFSTEDLLTFINNEVDVMRGCDLKYTYEFTRDAAEIDSFADIDIDAITDEDFQHLDIIRKAQQHGIGYRRWKR